LLIKTGVYLAGGHPRQDRAIIANQEFSRMEFPDPQWQPSAGFGRVAFWAISEGAGGGSYRLFSPDFYFASLRETAVGGARINARERPWASKPQPID
jgi:hypothetical protein